MTRLYVQDDESYVEASPERVLERAKELIAASFPTDGLVVRNLAVLQAFLMAQLQRESHVEFAVLFVDAEDRLLHYIELSFASLHQTLRHPRQLLRTALARDAARALLVRPYPPGTKYFSRQDWTAVQCLRKTLALAEIPLQFYVLTDGRLLEERGPRW